MQIINTILASLFIPIFIAVIAYELCVALMTKTILTRTPEYEKKCKFNKVCVGIGVTVSFLFMLKFGFTFNLLKATLFLGVLMMMTRCGINADDFYDSSDFKDVMNFNTHPLVISFGCAVSEIAEMGLREIESTVKNLQRIFVNTKFSYRLCDFIYGKLFL